MSELLMHESEIAALVGTIRARKAEISRLDEQVSAERKILEKLLLDRGSSWKDENGYAMIVAESERVSYDTKALDDLMLSDPLKYGWLYEYRRKSSVAASLKVK